MHKTSITSTDTESMKSHKETVTDKQTSVSLPVFVNLLQKTTFMYSTYPPMNRYQ